MAVIMLDLHKGDHLLDLCCAPGGKLVLSGLFLDALETTDDDGECDRSIQGGSTVAGVDISKARLLSAQSLVKKFKLSKARLYLQNSLDFAVGPLVLQKEFLPAKEISTVSVKLNKEKKTSTFMKHLLFASSTLRKFPCLQYLEPRYNKVLQQSWPHFFANNRVL